MSRLPIYAQGIVVAIVVISCFLLARGGIFGENIRVFSARVFPIHIAGIDPPRADVLLSFYFEVNTHDGWSRGRLGEKYPANSEMALFYNTNVPCWLLVVGIDKKGLYPVIYKTQDLQGFAPIYFEPLEAPHEIPFRLNGTIGNEAYIALASRHKFDFFEDIKPVLDEVARQEGKRGPQVKYSLSLDDLTQRTIYFETVSPK